MAGGETITLNQVVIPPPAPGMYRLELDLMAEGENWFSRMGCLGPQVEVSVLPTARGGGNGATEPVPVSIPK